MSEYNIADLYKLKTEIKDFHERHIIRGAIEEIQTLRTKLERHARQSPASGEVEPVGYKVRDELFFYKSDAVAASVYHSNHKDIEPLYTHPAPSQAVRSGVPEWVGSEIRSILDDAENYCWPVGPGGECKGCGNWNPRRNEMESHGHRDDCEAFSEFERRTDWRSRLETLLSTTPQPADPWIKCSELTMAHADERGDIWTLDDLGNATLRPAERVIDGWYSNIIAFQPTGLNRPKPPSEGKD